MGRVIDNPKDLSTEQLLRFCDRSDPIVKVLCERLETYSEALRTERVHRNEFKRELNSLMGMI